jgi:hypothetical protein
VINSVSLNRTGSLLLQFKDSVKRGKSENVRSHSYNKVIYVAAGSIVWGLPATGEQIDMHPGDRLELPREAVDDAQAGPNSVGCPESHCYLEGVRARTLRRSYFGEHPL